jgi:spore germination cell wall hydrolase CwlJ-like protein
MTQRRRKILSQRARRRARFFQNEGSVGAKRPLSGMICGVVFQNQHKRNACQFSFACDGAADIPKETAAWRQAQEVAKEVIPGKGLIKAVAGATHYHASYVPPRWASKLTRVSTIGSHVFYRG